MCVLVKQDERGTNVLTKYCDLRNKLHSKFLFCSQHYVAI